MNQSWIESVHPYTELAINGNDLDHPDLYEFLEYMKFKKVIAAVLGACMIMGIAGCTKNGDANGDKNGDTNPWANGHVYIESNSLFSLACGCHPENCRGGDVHTVTMQYRHLPSAKAVTLKVTFTIQGGGWWW